jgi:cytochrome c
MTLRLLATVLVLAAAAFGALASGRMSDAATQGQAIVRNACGTCHATELDDVSADADTPPFRDIARLYPPEDLSESLAEGIDTGHPEMPEFVFEPDAIGAIIAYLEWLRAQ